MRIKRYFSVVGHSPNEVELRYGIWNPVSHTISDASNSGILFKIISALDGTHNPSQIAQTLGVSRAEVEGVIDHLMQIGAVEAEAATAVDAYLDRLSTPLRGPSEREQPIRDVIVLGDDVLAPAVTSLLASSLTEREVRFVPPNDPLLEKLRVVEPGQLVNGLRLAEFIDLFTPWQNSFVILAQDTMQVSLAQAFNRVAIELGISWMHAIVDGPMVLIGPTMIPNRSACFECLETRVTMNMRELASYQRYKNALCEGRVRGAKFELEPALRALVASHTTMEAVNYLLTGTTYTIGKMLVIYLPTMEISFQEVLRLPGCAACGAQPYRKEPELYYELRGLLNG